MVPLLVFALLSASSPQGPKPPTQVVPSPMDSACRRTVNVAGFSDNERAYALSQQVRCRNPDGSRDTFGLIDIVDAAKGEVVATFQASPILRTGQDGKPLFAPPRVLASANPSWAHAFALHAWEKVRRGGHFKLMRHDFKDVLVRVRRDSDSPLDVKADGTKLRLLLNPKQPLGYTGVARLVDGSEVDLGHIREETPGRQVFRGNMEVVFSHHGHLLAMVHHGMLEDTIMVMRTPDDQPIASTQVGFMQMLQWDAASVKDLYGKLHPNGKEVWDEMIGTLE
jgi:hypothetical protein